MFNFVNYMHSLVNYAIFGELCDRMRFEVDCAKSHHRVISEGLQKCYLPKTAKLHSNIFLFSQIAIAASINK